MNGKNITSEGADLRDTGLNILGRVPWGTHFCNFFKTKEDLLEILVPYFKAGLENKEFCLWVTSEPVSVEDALEHLHKRIPSFNQYNTSKAIEVLPHAEWYLKDGTFDAQRIIDGWHEKLAGALARGYEGMRVNGNEAWLEREVWKDFVEYERALNNSIAGTRMIVLCTYPLDKCNGTDVLDVAHAHEMAVSMRGGSWDIVEVPAIRHTKAQMKMINDELQHRVHERTAELEEAIDQLNREIEEHKRTQASLEIRVRERTVELQQALDKAKQLASWKSRFASMASHEFKMPLTAIKLAVKHLRRYRTRMRPEKVDEKLLEILRQVEVMMRMIADLMMLGQADENKIVLNRQRVDIKAFFEGLKLEIEESHNRTHIIRYNFHLTRKHVDTDPNILRNIFVNLISNAIRFSPGKAEVEVDVYDEQTALRVDIKDQGVGIDVEDMAKIFEPFQRGTNAQAIAGTGLGLSIVKRAVALTGGSINVSSNLGKGSVFSVTIPVAE
jgi:signal transduction histidine kinase